MKKQRWIMKVLIAIAAALSAMLFAADITDRTELVFWIFNSITTKNLETFFIFIGLYFMYSRILLSEKYKSAAYSGDIVFSAFLAMCLLFGDACIKEHGLTALWCSWGQGIKSLLLICAYFLLMLSATRWACYFMQLYSKRDIEKKHIWDRHPFLFFFAVILILWLPQIIIKFPGTMCYDNYNQLSQYYGYIDFSANHPPIHTLILGLCFDFGLLFSSPNLGLFLAVLLQTLLLAAVFSHTLVMMTKMKSPRWLIVLSLIVYVLSPNIIGYIYLPVKDVPYSAFYVLFTSCAIGFALDSKSFWMDKKQVVLFILSAVMLVLLRHNGLITVIPVSLYVGIKTIVDNKGEIKRGIMRASSLLLILIIILGTETVVNVTLHPVSDSKGEAFSLLFQQTARYLRDHPDDVTAEEAAIINKVLDYENLGKLYDYRIADPIKSTFKRDSDTSDMFAYLGVWAKHFARHPLTYIEASVSQNYSLFYPQENNIKYYSSVHTHYELEPIMTETAGLHGVDAFKDAGENMEGFYGFLHILPVIGNLSNPGFITILLLLIWAVSRHYKLKGMGLTLTPALLTLGMCIFAPVIMLQSRYAFPMMYSIPIVAAVFLYLLDKKLRGHKTQDTDMLKCEGAVPEHSDNKDTLQKTE